MIGFAAKFYVCSDVPHTQKTLSRSCTDLCHAQHCLHNCATCATLTHIRLCHTQLCHARFCHTHTSESHPTSSHTTLLRSRTQLCHAQHCHTHSFVTYQHCHILQGQESFRHAQHCFTQICHTHTHKSSTNNSASHTLDKKKWRESAEEHVTLV